MSAVFDVANLTFTYPRGPTAVRNVSLSVGPPSMTSIIGANGSGKSTLIRLMMGLLTPTEGVVSLNRKPLGLWGRRARAREIGYVPQAMNVAFPFAALDVVLTGRSPHVASFRFEGDADRAKAIEALETVGAGPLANRTVTALSGGERQMVMLARALAQDPKLLLLDEPSAALDLKHRAALMRTLARLRDDRGLSVIMVTHDLQLMSGVFDRVIALRRGEIAADGPPQEVLQNHLLSAVYDDPGVQTHRMEGQTLIWTRL